MDNHMSNDRPRVLEQMNDFLIKKDDLFVAREKKIQEHMEELKRFEERLIAQATELKNQKEALQKEKELFIEEQMEKEKYFQKQDELIEEKWKEVYAYETECQKSMELLVAEKLKEQLDEMNILEKELMKTDSVLETSNMSALKALMGELEGVVTEYEEKNSSMLDAFATASKKIFPNSRIVDQKAHLLCIAIGSRELRIFAGENPEIHIVENKKNEKQMDSEVIHLNRLQTEWTFAFKDNHLMAVKEIDVNSAPDAILRQSKKAISEYFK